MRSLECQVEEPPKEEDEETRKEKIAKREAKAPSSLEHVAMTAWFGSCRFGVSRFQTLQIQSLSRALMCTRMESLCVLTT